MRGEIAFPSAGFISPDEGSVEDPRATTYLEIFDETIFTTAQLNISGRGPVYLT